MNDEKLMNDIRKGLYKHGKLAILFYKMEDEWIVHKWGEYENLSDIHINLFNKYHDAGFEDEANSLTVMELPQDEKVIYKILSGLSLKQELEKLGYTLE